MKFLLYLFSFLIGLSSFVGSVFAITDAEKNGMIPHQRECVDSGDSYSEWFSSSFHDAFLNGDYCDDGFTNDDSVVVEYRDSCVKPRNDSAQAELDSRNEARRILKESQLFFCGSAILLNSVERGDVLEVEMLGGDETGDIRAKIPLQGALKNAFKRSGIYTTWVEYGSPDMSVYEFDIETLDPTNLVADQQGPLTNLEFASMPLDQRGCYNEGDSYSRWSGSSEHTKFLNGDYCGQFLKETDPVVETYADACVNHMTDKGARKYSALFLRGVQLFFCEGTVLSSVEEEGEYLRVKMAGRWANNNTVMAGPLKQSFLRSPLYLEWLEEKEAETFDPVSLIADEQGPLNDLEYYSMQIDQRGCYGEGDSYSTWGASGEHTKLLNGEYCGSISEMPDSLIDTYQRYCVQPRFPDKPQSVEAAKTKASLILSSAQALFCEGTFVNDVVEDGEFISVDFTRGTLVTGSNENASYSRLDMINPTLVFAGALKNAFLQTPMYQDWLNGGSDANDSNASDADSVIADQQGPLTTNEFASMPYHQRGCYDEGDSYSAWSRSSEYTKFLDGDYCDVVLDVQDDLIDVYQSSCVQPVVANNSRSIEAARDKAGIILDAAQMFFCDGTTVASVEERGEFLKVKFKRGITTANINLAGPLKSAFMRHDLYLDWRDRVENNGEVSSDEDDARESGPVSQIDFASMPYYQRTCYDEGDDYEQWVSSEFLTKLRNKEYCGESFTDHHDALKAYRDACYPSGRNATLSRRFTELAKSRLNASNVLICGDFTVTDAVEDGEFLKVSFHKGIVRASNIALAGDFKTAFIQTSAYQDWLSNQINTTEESVSSEGAAANGEDDSIASLIVELRSLLADYFEDHPDAYSAISNKFNYLETLNEADALLRGDPAYRWTDGADGLVPVDTEVPVDDSAIDDFWNSDFTVDDSDLDYPDDIYVWDGLNEGVDFDASTLDYSVIDNASDDGDYFAWDDYAYDDSSIDYDFDDDWDDSFGGIDFDDSDFTYTGVSAESNTEVLTPDDVSELLAMMDEDVISSIEAEEPEIMIHHPDDLHGGASDAGHCRIVSDYFDSLFSLDDFNLGSDVKRKSVSVLNNLRSKYVDTSCNGSWPFDGEVYRFPKSGDEALMCNGSRSYIHQRVLLSVVSLAASELGLSADKNDYYSMDLGDNMNDLLLAWYAVDSLSDIDDLDRKRNLVEGTVCGVANTELAKYGSSGDLEDYILSEYDRLNAAQEQADSERISNCEGNEFSCAYIACRDNYDDDFYDADIDTLCIESGGNFTALEKDASGCWKWQASYVSTFSSYRYKDMTGNSPLKTSLPLGCERGDGNYLVPGAPVTEDANGCFEWTVSTTGGVKIYRHPDRVNRFGNNLPEGCLLSDDGTQLVMVGDESAGDANETLSRVEQRLLPEDCSSDACDRVEELLDTYKLATNAQRASADLHIDKILNAFYENSSIHMSHIFAYYGQAQEALAAGNASADSVVRCSISDSYDEYMEIACGDDLMELLFVHDEDLRNDVEADSDVMVIGNGDDGAAEVVEGLNLPSHLNPYYQSHCASMGDITVTRLAQCIKGKFDAAFVSSNSSTTQGGSVASGVVTDAQMQMVEDALNSHVSYGKYGPFKVDRFIAGRNHFALLDQYDRELTFAVADSADDLMTFFGERILVPGTYKRFVMDHDINLIYDDYQKNAVIAALRDYDARGWFIDFAGDSVEFYKGTARKKPASNGSFGPDGTLMGEYLADEDTVSVVINSDNSLRIDFEDGRDLFIVNARLGNSFIEISKETTSHTVHDADF